MLQTVREKEKERNIEATICRVIVIGWIRKRRWKRSKKCNRYMRRDNGQGTEEGGYIHLRHYCSHTMPVKNAETAGVLFLPNGVNEYAPRQDRDEEGSSNPQIIVGLVTD